ncbi:MAG: sigma-70 family RNA polymerase sigma factor [Armatimonadota bacterium]
MSTLFQGSAETYEELVARHRAAFQRLARRLAGNAEDADDLLQETLIDAYRGFHRFRADSQFYSWVARIMTNNHLDRVRRKQHPTVSLEQTTRDGQSLDLPDPDADPEEALLLEHLDQPFQTALDSLQPVHRATVLLCDLEGATYEEAAQAEECPVGTIRSRLHRAHNYLRKLLGGIGGAEEEPAAAPRAHSRRAFLRMGTVAAAGAAMAHLSLAEEAEASGPVRVLVCGSSAETSAAAETLGRDASVEVVTVDPAGLDDAALRRAEVLVYLGGELPADRAAVIARRVRDEGMGLVALHGAMESSLLRPVLGGDCRWTGAMQASEAPLELRVTAPRHPVASGLSGFHIQDARHFTGAWDGPRPDVVVFDTTAGDARIWQGLAWNAAKGRVFYFQPAVQPGDPSHELQRLLHNALLWTARRA